MDYRELIKLHSSRGVVPLGFGVDGYKRGDNYIMSVAANTVHNS